MRVRRFAGQERKNQVNSNCHCLTSNLIVTQSELSSISTEVMFILRTLVQWFTSLAVGHMSKLLTIDAESGGNATTRNFAPQTHFSWSCMVFIHFLLSSIFLPCHDFPSVVSSCLIRSNNLDLMMWNLDDFLPLLANKIHMV